MQRMWYVAYGTNLSWERFRMYLQGGRPWVGGRDHPGCRDPFGPQREMALMVPGGIRFVGNSTIWGGGTAVYDAGAAAEVAVRAYLITAEQFVDILAQEMRLEPRLDLDLGPVQRTGWHSLGPWLPPPWEGAVFFALHASDPSGQPSKSPNFGAFLSPSKYAGIRRISARLVRI